MEFRITTDKAAIDEAAPARNPIKVNERFLNLALYLVAFLAPATSRKF